MERENCKYKQKKDLVDWWKGWSDKSSNGIPSLSSIRKQRRASENKKPDNRGKACDFTWDQWWPVEEAPYVRDFKGHNKKVEIIRNNLKEE